MNKLSLLLLLVFSFSYSQNFNGKVTYNVILSEDNSLYKEKDKLYLNALSASKDIEYTLIFNKKEAYFFLENSLKDQDPNYKFASIFSGYINPIYSNFKKNEYSYYPQQNPFFKSKEYLIKEDMPVAWELNNETKKIGDYECFKATVKVPSFSIKTTSDNSFEYNEYFEVITAWYTPQIPVATGPMGYGNLPGLILELRTEKAVYGAKLINLNAKTEQSEIKAPDAEKEVGYFEYIKLHHKQMQDMRKR